MGEALSEMLAGLWEAGMEILAAIYEFLTETFIPFAFWTLIGILVLPCVYVAGNIYPQWVEWGENL